MDRIGRDRDESVLRRAFEETLDILGQRMKESIIYDLENSGEYHSDTQFSLEKIAL
jgi:DNA-binding HxlR family transcriptional regulator